MRCSIRTTRYVNKDDRLVSVYEDDLERFFPSRAWTVPPAQIWRWRAAVMAARALDVEV